MKNDQIISNRLYYYQILNKYELLNNIEKEIYQLDSEYEIYNNNDYSEVE